MISSISTPLVAETYCDTLPTTIAEPEDIGLVGGNDDSRAIGNDSREKGSSGEIFWRDLDLARREPTKTEEPTNLVNGTSGETSKRKSRFLGSLAFLAGLGFGGLATAASSTVKTFTKLPQTSFTLNLGSTSKSSPYITAYYNPYSLLPYPFLYPGAIGLVPTVDPTKPQTTSHNDLAPQVISVFDDNRPPIDLEEYHQVDVEKKSDKSASNNGAGYRTELRTDTDRHAEEKVRI